MIGYILFGVLLGVVLSVLAVHIADANDKWKMLGVGGSVTVLVLWTLHPLFF